MVASWIPRRCSNDEATLADGFRGGLPQDLRVPLDCAQGLRGYPGKIAAHRLQTESCMDGLARHYFDSLRRHPPLPLAEQQSLAAEYHRTGDERVRQRLATANLRLVVKIARKSARYGASVMDLIQEGNVGLLHAIAKYDPSRGTRLSSYAALWIHAYILRYLLADARLVRIGRTQAERKIFFNLKRAAARLARAGITAGSAQLAEEIGVPEEDVRQMRARLRAPDASIDAAIEAPDGGRSATLSDRLVDERPLAETLVGENELRARVQKEACDFAGRLDQRERDLFAARWLSEEPPTLAEMGRRFRVSRERARQIETRLLARFGQRLAEVLSEAA